MTTDSSMLFSLIRSQGPQTVVLVLNRLKRRRRALQSPFPRPRFYPSLPVMLVGLLEDRVVRRRPLLLGPAVRVVVERDRLAAPPLRAGEGPGVAMERE